MVRIPMEEYAARIDLTGIPPEMRLAQIEAGRGQGDWLRYMRSGEGQWFTRLSVGREIGEISFKPPRAATATTIKEVIGSMDLFQERGQLI